MFGQVGNYATGWWPLLGRRALRALTPRPPGGNRDALLDQVAFNARAYLVQTVCDGVQGKSGPQALRFTGCIDEGFVFKDETEELQLCNGVVENVNGIVNGHGVTTKRFFLFAQYSFFVETIC